MFRFCCEFRCLRLKCLDSKLENNNFSFLFGHNNEAEVDNIANGELLETDEARTDEDLISTKQMAEIDEIFDQNWKKRTKLL